MARPLTRPLTRTLTRRHHALHMHTHLLSAERLKLNPAPRLNYTLHPKRKNGLRCTPRLFSCLPPRCRRSVWGLGSGIWSLGLRHPPLVAAEHVTSSCILCHIIIHTMSHHHTYYVTSSYILCHIIIHILPLVAAGLTGPLVPVPNDCSLMPVP